MCNFVNIFLLGKRYGFQRSEEIGVQPHLRSRAFQRQLSKENETPTSAPATASNQSPLVLTHQRDQHHSMPHDMKSERLSNMFHSISMRFIFFLV